MNEREEFKTVLLQFIDVALKQRRYIKFKV